MGHNHSHHHHKKLSGKKLLFSIILNILITVSQVIGGIISGSLALISDAVHNLSDVISLITICDGAKSIRILRESIKISQLICNK